MHFAAASAQVLYPDIYLSCTQSGSAPECCGVNYNIQQIFSSSQLQLQMCFKAGLNKSRGAMKCCWSSVWNLLHVSLLAPMILRWLPDFWEICASLFTKKCWSYDIKIFVGASDDLRKATIGFMSVRLFPCNDSVPTRRIIITFDV